MDASVTRWARVCFVGFLGACGSDAAPLGSGAAGQAGAAAGSAGASHGGTGGSAAALLGGAGQATGGAGQANAGSGGLGALAGAAGAAGTAGAGGSGGQPAVLLLPKRVLLYHTAAVASIPAQLVVYTTTLEGWGYEVEVSTAASSFTTQNLERFAAVAMINPCFEPFGAGNAGVAETAALSAFVDNGGGLFGTHCASVTFQSAEPPATYNVLIGGRGGGGYFNGKSACRTTDEAHPTSAGLAATFDYNGDLDNADFVALDTKVLVRCKWSGGDQKDVAVTWYRTQGKGRVFYTNFAKEDADLKDAVLGPKHILLGFGWVLGR